MSKITILDKIPAGHPLAGCTVQFRKAVDAATAQPDPKKAFRKGLVETIQENHPGASKEAIEEMLDAFGA